MARTAEKLDKVAPQQAQPQVDTLGTIKKQKGKSDFKPMETLDIVKHAYIQEAGSEQGYDEFLKKLATLLQNPNVRLVRFLNTLFLTMKMSDEVAEVKILTADQPDHIALTVQDMAKVLQKNGFKKAVSASNLPVFVDIAKKTGLPVKISQGQTVIGNQAVPSYIFELDL